MLCFPRSLYAYYSKKAHFWFEIPDFGGFFDKTPLFLNENADIIGDGLEFFHRIPWAVDPFEIDLTVPGLRG